MGMDRNEFYQCMPPLGEDNKTGREQNWIGLTLHYLWVMFSLREVVPFKNMKRTFLASFHNVKKYESTNTI